MEQLRELERQLRAAQAALDRWHDGCRRIAEELAEAEQERDALRRDLRATTLTWDNAWTLTWDNACRSILLERQLRAAQADRDRWHDECRRIAEELAEAEWMMRRPLQAGEHTDMAGAVIERVQVGQWSVRIILQDGRELLAGCTSAMSGVFAEVTGEEEGTSDAEG